MGLHAHDWVWREHDFVQCIVLLVDDPVRVLARGVGLEEGSGHSPGWAKGSGPGWEPLNLKDRVITDRRWMQAPPRGKNSSRRASMEEWWFTVEVVGCVNDVVLIVDIVDVFYSMSV